MTSFTETHPALAVLPWEWDEDYPRGIHGIANYEKFREIDNGPVQHSYKCFCGWKTRPYATRDDAFAALVGHAEHATETVRRPGVRMKAIYEERAIGEPEIEWLIVATTDGLGIVGNHDWAVRTISEVEAAFGPLALA